MDRGADTLLTCPGDPSGEAQAAGAWLEVSAVLLSMLHLPWALELPWLLIQYFSQALTAVKKI